MLDVVRELGLAGTTALIVVNFTHPIDMVKTRMQVEAKFSLRNMIKEEGLLTLYKGIQPAWMREASYTSVKLGLYGPIKKALGANTPDAPFVLKFAAGSMAGGLGSVLGNPFDVLKTLQITQHGRGGDSTLTLFRRVVSEYGVSGLYRGVQANAMRACVLNGTKMACYDQIKGYVVTGTGWGRSDLRTQFFSAGGAGFCMAVTVSPFDFLRTQLMNQQKQVYSGFLDCLQKTVREKGPLALYRGFFPIWARFAPQATGQLLVFEMLRKLAGMETI